MKWSSSHFVQFLPAYYASHATFPSNFGVRIGAFWYFFQNGPKSLHKIGFFLTLRLFLSSFKFIMAGNIIISLVYTIYWAKLAKKVNFDPKILAALAQSNVVWWFCLLFSNQAVLNIVFFCGRSLYCLGKWDGRYLSLKNNIVPH